MKTLIVALHKDGKLASATFELIEAAKGLGNEIYTVILADSADAMAAELAARGGGKVLAVSDPGLKDFNDEVYTNVVTELIEKYSPELVLGPGTFYGKALFARLAARNNGPMTSDATGLTQDGGVITVTRPSYGGAVVSEVIKNSDRPFFVTIRPKIFPESKDGDGEAVAETVAAAGAGTGTAIREVKVESSGSVNLAEADVIVAAGRGMKAAENLQLIKDLAVATNGALGASRAIVDAGWTEYANQVGQTGKTVNPKLYFAIGISGAIQHIVGMRTSGTIVAINKDKDAPIFNLANYGIIGDALEVVPALTAKFKTELG
ncbi:MAG: electron transfer flavoprotein subunit alpha/FixB family protein [candidate division Zixibacteria bacterium]|nr:electron transfer flavoprotein subunit alpha/FixB family protein [candidate division Zixibacteria bacterium]